MHIFVIIRNHIDEILGNKSRIIHADRGAGTYFIYFILDNWVFNMLYLRFNDKINGKQIYGIHIGVWYIPSLSVI